MNIISPERQLEDIINSRLTKPMVAFKCSELEALMDSSSDIEAAANTLVNTGKWDNVPSVGYLYDVWYSKQALQLEANDPSFLDIHAADVALGHRTAYSQWKSWVQLSSGVSRETVLDCAVRCHPFFIKKIHKVTRHDVGFLAVTAIHAALAARYLKNSGFTTMNYKSLAHSTGCSERQIKGAVEVLIETGLWGITRGSGRNASRFYPLFTDDGLSAYQDLFAD